MNIFHRQLNRFLHEIIYIYNLILCGVWTMDSVVWAIQRSVGAGCPSYLCSVARCCDAALGWGTNFTVMWSHNTCFEIRGM